MAITVNTNVNSLLAQQYLANSQSGLAEAMQRLSSGQRVNSAKDDAAGLAIAQGLLSASTGLRRGSQNANDGVSLVQTTQSALQTSLNMLQRMRSLALQAKNGTNGTTNLSDLDREFQALNTEINRIATVTSFNNISLLNNSTGSLSIQVGNNNTANDSITITLTNATTGSAGLDIAGDDITTAGNADTAITDLDSAISSVTSGLAKLGAAESNIGYAIQGNDAIATSFEAAKSRIMDTDYTVESANMAKFSVLNQSGIAMLAQANAIPQMVLQLLK